MDIPRDPSIINVKSGLIIPYQAADYLVKLVKFETIKNTEELYRYEDNKGYWINDGEEYIKHELTVIYKENITSHLVNEVIFLIKHRNYIEEIVGLQGFINLNNGVYDIKNARLLGRNPEYGFTYCLPFNYDQKAECEEILNFLVTVADGDPDKILLLLEALAYAFIPGYPIQVAFMLVGSGSNGKSTFLNLLEVLVGHQNRASLSLQNLTDKTFGLHKLRGKLINVSADLPDKKILESGMFKKLTGDDSVEADIKFKEGVDFHNTAKLYFSANKIPDVEDNSYAFFRRWIIIEFTKTFDRDSQDKAILARITSPSELSGLFNVLSLLFIPKLFKTMKLHYNLNSDEAQELYMLKGNTAKAFIDKYIEYNPEARIEKRLLYSHYIRFCSNRKLIQLSEKAFIQALRDSGIMYWEKRGTDGGIRIQELMGISISNDFTKDVLESSITMEDSKLVKNSNTILEKYLNMSGMSGMSYIIYSLLKIQNKYIEIYKKSLTPLTSIPDQPINFPNNKSKSSITMEVKIKEIDTQGAIVICPKCGKSTTKLWEWDKKWMCTDCLPKSSELGQDI